MRNRMLLFRTCPCCLSVSASSQELFARNRAQEGQLRRYPVPMRTAAPADIPSSDLLSAKQIAGVQSVKACICDSRGVSERLLCSATICLSHSVSVRAEITLRLDSSSEPPRLRGDGRTPEAATWGNNTRVFASVQTGFRLRVTFTSSHVRYSCHRIWCRRVHYYEVDGPFDSDRF